ncbi:hypothetical protein NPIL_326531, partial [Nephila pilipes]
MEETRRESSERDGSNEQTQDQPPLILKFRKAGSGKYEVLANHSKKSSEEEKSTSEEEKSTSEEEKNTSEREIKNITSADNQLYLWDKIDIVKLRRRSK